MHVPKSGGTSITWLLWRVFAQRHLCPKPADNIWRARELSGYRLYHGHFDIDFIHNVDRRGKRLIILRHPVERVISLYDFWRSYRHEYIASAPPDESLEGPVLAKSLDFKGFIEQAAPLISNQASRQLLGHRFEELCRDRHALINESIRSLHSFAWVGILERFEMSVKLLRDVIGPRLPTVLPHRNRTYAKSPTNQKFERVERTIPTQEERELMISLNDADLALFNEGCSMMDKRLQAILQRWEGNYL